MMASLVEILRQAELTNDRGTKATGSCGVRGENNTSVFDLGEMWWRDKDKEGKKGVARKKTGGRRKKLEEDK